MTHEPIESIRLLPRKVLVFCSNSDSSKRDRTWRGNPCDGSATLLYVADGRSIGAVCQTCADRNLPILQRVDPESEWSTAPLYHDNPDYPNQSLDRATGKL